MEPDEIGVGNKQFVITKEDKIVISNPSSVMTKEEALVHAAHLVALADQSENFETFRTILKRVLQR